MSETEIVKEYTPLVLKIAKRYKGFGLSREDLVQEGLIGLVKAARGYDARKGDFGGYAYIAIANAMTAAIGWAPGRKTLAKPPKEIPLDVAPSDENSLANRLPDTGPSPEVLCAESERRGRVKAALGQLPARSREIVTDHYMHGTTLETAGARHGLSAERARQIQARAFETLSKRLAHVR